MLPRPSLPIRVPPNEALAWLDRLQARYPMPRMALARLFVTPGALEYEVGILISETAWRVARRLLDERERPDEGVDLFSRAVAGCYTQLREAEMARSRAAIRGMV